MCPGDGFVRKVWGGRDEYTMPAAAVQFGFSTVNTGYWDTG